MHVESTRVMGAFLRDTMKLNEDSRNFRLFSPDENNSNRWQDALEVTNRAWMAERFPYDDHLAPDGRVMEMLSEHQMPGLARRVSADRPARVLLVLRGVHPHHRFDVQSARQVAQGVQSHPAGGGRSRRSTTCCPRTSGARITTASVTRTPGFIDHVVNKKAEVVRVYLPPDANTLLSVTDHCLRSRNYVNVIVAGKQPAPQWLTMDQAIKHCTAGIGIWEFASNDKGGEPDVVMACCGDVPTLETLAAVDLLRQHLPALKVRVVNVVNLMKLQPPSEHPHGMPDADFDLLFTKRQADHLCLPRVSMADPPAHLSPHNHDNMHVRGYKEEGTTSTPFDMVVMNDLDRFHLFGDVIDRLPQLGSRAAYAKQAMNESCSSTSSTSRSTAMTCRRSPDGAGVRAR